jgi:uncharacterized protein (TIGR01619 family)
LKEDWDFYPCRVDDAPGSIFVNLALAHQLEDLQENTLYVVRIKMVDGDTHGMGSSEEANTLYRAEDALVAELSAMAVRFIGRLRNLGNWQLTFMGPPGIEPDIERLAEIHLDRLPRQYSIDAENDPEWSYYSDFLFPDAERMRWIQDRRVVDALQRHGDPLTQRRRVDHWIYFPDRDSQCAFASAVAEDGFQLLEPQGEAPDFGVQVYRVDSVQLNDIHEVTHALTALAERFNGNYDGWETSVESN